MAGRLHQIKLSYPVRVTRKIKKMNEQHPLANIIERFLGDKGILNSLCGIYIEDALNTNPPDAFTVIRNLNAAWFIALAGTSHPLYQTSRNFIKKIKDEKNYSNIIHFYERALKRSADELNDLLREDQTFSNDYHALLEFIRNQTENGVGDQARAIQKFFFPEGPSEADIHEPLQAIEKLRQKRRVTIKSLNADPIRQPETELLFTSNILTTLPLKDQPPDSPELSDDLKQKLKAISSERQKHWYDHPIPIGITAEKNEALYGMGGLESMMTFEKQLGNIDGDAKITCLLSASTTHDGLHEIIKPWFEEQFKKHLPLKHIDLYIFSENDCLRLLEEVLTPLARKYFPNDDIAILRRIFGVDGEYGRHYSFLKAIAAFWQVFIDPEIKGTFKIDLDQIFPQHELRKESGLSAFGHFKTPLWGAKGTDSDGNPVELGMIAGALVNKSDINRSVFTPDVTFPPHETLIPEQLVFHSRWPQALSTEAEMTTRYPDENFNGVNRAIQRIHVTGGTNGILIDSLRRHRPFTPTIIGRAEDQAYLLSVLFEGPPWLRYLHKPGLIMRHDKHAFAGQAIAAAAVGKQIGDYVRILVFSFYARALPWSFEKIKDAIDPFSGCFVSKMPVTLVILRFMLQLAELCAGDHRDKALQFAEEGARRLLPLFERRKKSADKFLKIIDEEKQGWHLYYDILDRAERDLKNSDAFVLQMRRRAINIVNNSAIRFE